MHRHGYKGRKFGREANQRKALIKGLADSLVLSESIVTTLPKAKELIPYTEKLITKAKKGDLHNRRQVINGLNTLEAAHKLVDDIVPKLSSRNSGYFSLKRTTLRRGDSAQMAKVSFVDDLKAEVKKSAKKTESIPTTKSNPVSKKSATPSKKEAKQ